MGSPEPAAALLSAVAALAEENGWEMAAVYAAPDKPAGRGRRPAPSPVRRRAEELGLPALTPAKLTEPDEAARFREMRPGLVVLAAYGLLLPPPFLYEPRLGAVNVHPSLLPRHRGASPVAAAILAGDAETGTTLMTMTERLDAGPVLAQRRVALDGGERTPQLTERLFALGAEMLRETLPRYVAGEVAPHPQDETAAGYAPRMTKADGEIVWTEPAVLIERKTRAYDPWPGTATRWEGRRLAVTAASVEPNPGGLAPGWTRRDGDGGLAPGRTRRDGDGVLVGAGEGALRLLRVKPEGGAEMPVADFLRGRPAFADALLPS